MYYDLIANLDLEPCMGGVGTRDPPSPLMPLPMSTCNSENHNLIYPFHRYGLIT